MTAYRALALQTRLDTINAQPDVISARELMHRTIDRIGSEVAAAAAWIGRDLRLVVLPEYFMTGYAMGDPIEQWTEKAAINADGPEYERLGEIARAHNLFLAGNAFERDENFPGMNFQCCFIVGPDGKVILRYRRLNSMYTPTPHDVWDRYLEIYGAEAIFPVAETEIGALATIASEEILYPEIARMAAFSGAEILLHPTSEVGAPGLTPKHICKRARAVENMAYVVSANSAGIHGTPVPAASTDGMSIIIDPYGRALAEAGTGETLNANGLIDLGALREARRKTGMTNTLSRIPAAAFAGRYLAARHAEPNRTPDGRMVDRSGALAFQQSVIDRLLAAGILK